MSPKSVALGANDVKVVEVRTTLSATNTVCSEKIDQNVYHNISHKTRSILMKFATWFPENHVANFIRTDRVLSILPKNFRSLFTRHSVYSPNNPVFCTIFYFIYIYLFASDYYRVHNTSTTQIHTNAP